MSESIQVYTLALQVPPPNVTAVQYSNRKMFGRRMAIVYVVDDASELADLTDEELRALLNDDSLPLARQIRVLDERRHRAAERRKAEEMAEPGGDGSRHGRFARQRRDSAQSPDSA